MKKIIVLAVLFFLFTIPLNKTHAAYLAHSVQVNQSFYSISKLHGLSLESLLTLNNATEDSSRLITGQAVRLDRERPVTVLVNSEKLVADTPFLIINSRIMIPIRSFFNAIGVESVYWNQSQMTAYVEYDNSLVQLPVGSNHITFKNKQYYSDVPVTLYQGRVYIPIRAVSEMLSMVVNWNDSTSTATITSDDASLYWLSRIVHAEASGESYEGKLAVANVILNRVSSTQFPNNVKDVIFDTAHAIQYTPAYNGMIYNNPSADSIRAAQSALSGQNNIGKALYFLNPNKVRDSWIIRNRPFFMRIGNHDFYL